MNFVAILAGFILTLALPLPRPANAPSPMPTQAPKCVASTSYIDQCDCDPDCISTWTVIGLNDAEDCIEEEGPCTFGYWKIQTICQAPCPDGQKTGTNTAVDCSDEMEIIQRCGTGSAKGYLVCGDCA